MPTDPRPREFNVTISGEAYEVLTRMAEERCEPLTDTLASAIALLQEVHAERRRGGHVVIPRRSVELVP